MGRKLSGGESQTGQLLLSAVPPEMVDAVWSQVEPMVNRGLSKGEGDCTTPERIKENIKRQDNLLWAVHDTQEVIAVVVLSIIQHPAKKTVFVVLTAGERFHDWVNMVQDNLKTLKELVGADTIEASVRDGLTKWLKATGWKRKATIMELV